MPVARRFRKRIGRFDARCRPERVTDAGRCWRPRNGTWSGLTSISGVSTFMTKPGFRSSSHDIRIVLPIKELEPGLGPFSSICMELPTPRGFIDNLLMTSTGDIALIETKLFRNPEATRKVLAQVIDYAGCLFQMTYEQFEHAVLSARAMSSRVAGDLLCSISCLKRTNLPSMFFTTSRQNLRRGKVLILICGRWNSEQPSHPTGQHPGARMVELYAGSGGVAIFHLPELAGPRLCRGLSQDMGLRVPRPPNKWKLDPL